MLSLVIGQSDGRRYRVHKNFYEIPPGWFRELADQFLDFFNSHTFKTLNLYYDRSGNNFQKQGEDYAGKIKEAIEKDAAGRRTGWTVVLKSRKQATIKQNAEYDFMHELMRGENERLPLLLVDVLNCPEMVCSIEGAKAEVKHRKPAKGGGESQENRETGGEETPPPVNQLLGRFQVPDDAPRVAERRQSRALRSVRSGRTCRTVDGRPIRRLT